MFDLMLDDLETVKYIIILLPIYQQLSVITQIFIPKIIRKNDYKNTTCIINR